MLILVVLCLLPVSLHGLDCSEFNIGQCQRNVLQVVDLDGGNVTSCQSICQDTSGCREFHFNLFSEKCTLSAAAYPTCNVMSGPASPLVDECMNGPVGCSAFKDEDCNYKGEAANTMDQMADPRSCQMFMNELGPEFGGGNYFIHQKSPKGSCEMLLSNERSCLGVSGPPSPDYETCF